MVRFWLLAICFYSTVSAVQAEWRAVEKIETYAISGNTGAELYRSIGEHGPGTGNSRAIAQTNFKLTWTRKYEPRGNACVLVSAKPKLTISYLVPEPTGRLPAATAKSWEAFIAGVQAHEREHGETIVEMVRKIEAATVGLTVADDRACRKIRAQMVPLLSGLSQEQRQKSRAFDAEELSAGGTVRQLVMRLVNGP